MSSQQQQSGQSSWFSIGSFINAVAEKSKQVVETVAKDLKDVTQDMSNQFTVERDKFEAANTVDYETVLPWEQPNIGDLQDECKQEVFKLSEDEKIFRIPPPDGVYTDFDLLKRSQLAFRLCEEDTRLRDRSLKMIRRTDMNENDFWRNYFYRVDIIVASCMEKAQMLYNQSNKGLNSDNLTAATNNNTQPIQQQQQQQQNVIPISPQVNAQQNQNHLPQVNLQQTQQTVTPSVIKSPTLSTATIKTTETLQLNSDVIEPPVEQQQNNEEDIKPVVQEEEEEDDDVDDDELDELLKDASSGDDDDDDGNLDEFIENELND